MAAVNIIAEDKVVPPEEQLICECYVKDLDASIAFYKSYGFVVLREEPLHFAELAWGRNRLYLEQVEQEYTPHLACNIRVMVPDVDRLHALSQAAGHTIVRELSDKYYGLRDFTVSGPDGVGLRFATPIPGHHQH